MTNFLIKHLGSQPGMSESYVESILSDWESHDYVVDGEVVGTAMLKGTEIHFALNPEKYKKALRREPMREAIKPLFERMGFLTTRILMDYYEQARFVKRVGFEKTWSDGRFDYYLLANLPYERKAK